jgi:hypothetical protein
MRWVWCAALIACGRVGFDQPGGKDGRGPNADASFFDAPGTMSLDAAPPPDGVAASCANFDLGSALGAVATGNTTGHPDTYHTCNGQGSPDVSYAWTAPAAGTYTIDTCGGPDQSLDTTLTVLNGDCTGTRLACDDDGCGTFLSRAHVTLTAGQLVIIVVDGDDDMGRYTLKITSGG